MKWFLKVVRDNYANFSGRARRKEYWMFYLFFILLILPIAFIGGLLSDLNQNIEMIFISIFGLLFIALFIPSLAVTVRRLHDSGKSGWFILLRLIPFIGGLVLLIFLIQDSQVGDNQWGPDPKAGEPGH